MGAIVLNTNKVNTNVLPSLEKAMTILQDSYSTSTNLKKKLPNSFSYKSTVNNIITKINSLKSEVNKIDKDITKQIEKVKKTEDKKVSETSKTSTLFSRLANNNINFGNVKINNTTNKIKGDVVNNSIGKDVKKGITDTGAKTTTGFVSKIKSFGTNTINKIKEVGTKVSDSFKSMINSLNKSKEVATEWLKEKFEKAKEKTNDILKNTGATIKTIRGTILDKAKEVGNVVKKEIKRTLASIANTVIYFTKGLVGFVESIGDLIVLIGAGYDTLIAGIVDIIRGIVTGNWEWITTKELWNGTKSIVAYQWTDKIYNKLYATEIGKKINENAYTPFKTGGIACQIVEGIGYIAGVITLTVATFGVGGAVVGTGASSTTMAITATAAGIGKYTEEEWNKNSLSITYGEQELALNIDYEKYKEIIGLKNGESTIVTEIIINADGSTSKITFTITMNDDETYSIKDNEGNDVIFNGVKESSTAKGVLVGGIKGTWEGLQWYIGSKIGAGQFSKVTSAIKNEASKKMATSGIRVVLDSLTGAVEVPFQSLVTMIFEKKSWKEAWESQGGWSAVASQIGIAGISSAFGEAVDLRKNLKMEEPIKVIKKDNILDFYGLHSEYLSHKDSVKQLSEYYGDGGSFLKSMLLGGKNISQVEYDFDWIKKQNENDFIIIQNYLQNTRGGKYLKKLSDTEISSVADYTGGFSSEINDCLRKQHIPDIIRGKNAKSLIDNIDSAIIKYGGLEESSILYRGISVDSFFSQLSVYAELFDGINKGDLKQVYCVLKLLEGKECYDFGYMSTSPAYGTSFARYTDYPVVLEIVAPKGTPGAYINQFSQFYNKENEFLLARATKLEIFEVLPPKKINGLKKIIVRCLIKKDIDRNDIYVKK